MRWPIVAQALEQIRTLSVLADRRQCQHGEYLVAFTGLCTIEHTARRMTDL
jgi:hypothetical protein